MTGLREVEGAGKLLIVFVEAMVFVFATLEENMC